MRARKAMAIPVIAALAISGAAAFGGCGSSSNAATNETAQESSQHEGGAMKNESGAMKDESGAMKDEGGAMKDEGGAMKDESGAMKDESGAMKDESSGDHMEG